MFLSLLYKAVSSLSEKDAMESYVKKVEKIKTDGSADFKPTQENGKTVSS